MHVVYSYQLHHIAGMVLPVYYFFPYSFHVSYTILMQLNLFNISCNSVFAWVSESPLPALVRPPELSSLPLLPLPSLLDQLALPLYLCRAVQFSKWKYKTARLIWIADKQQISFLKISTPRQYLEHTYVKKNILLFWNSSLMGSPVFYQATLAFGPHLCPVSALPNRVSIYSQSSGGCAACPRNRVQIPVWTPGVPLYCSAGLGLLWWSGEGVLTRTVSGLCICARLLGLP